MIPPDCGAAPVRHAVFPTALGVCGVAWRDGTLVRLQLPEATPEATRARMLRGLSGRGEAAEPEGVAAEAVAGVQALFAGHGPALDHLPLAWDDVAPLTRRVLEACRAIPHRRWAATRSRPWCPATASWAPTGGSADFPAATDGG